MKNDKNDKKKSVHFHLQIYNHHHQKPQHNSCEKTRKNNHEPPSLKEA